jgi:hypothetical protein
MVSRAFRLEFGEQGRALQLADVFRSYLMLGTKFLAVVIHETAI